MYFFGVVEVGLDLKSIELLLDRCLTERFVECRIYNDIKTAPIGVDYASLILTENRCVGKHVCRNLVRVKMG